MGHYMISKRFPWKTCRILALRRNILDRRISNQAFGPWGKVAFCHANDCKLLTYTIRQFGAMITVENSTDVDIRAGLSNLREIIVENSVREVALSCLVTNCSACDLVRPGTSHAQ